MGLPEALTMGRSMGVGIDAVSMEERNDIVVVV
jgi:hypothetical protein